MTGALKVARLEAGRTLERVSEIGRRVFPPPFLTISPKFSFDYVRKCLSGAAGALVSIPESVAHTDKRQGETNEHAPDRPRG